MRSLRFSVLKIIAHFGRVELGGLHRLCELHDRVVPVSRNPRRGLAVFRPVRRDELARSGSGDFAELKQRRRPEKFHAIGNLERLEAEHRAGGDRPPEPVFGDALDEAFQLPAPANVKHAVGKEPLYLPAENGEVARALREHIGVELGAFEPHAKGEVVSARLAEHRIHAHEHYAGVAPARPLDGFREHIAVLRAVQKYPHGIRRVHSRRRILAEKVHKGVVALGNPPVPRHHNLVEPDGNHPHPVAAQGVEIFLKRQLAGAVGVARDDFYFQSGDPARSVYFLGAELHAVERLARGGGVFARKRQYRAHRIDVFAELRGGRTTRESRRRNRADGGEKFCAFRIHTQKC